MTLRFGKEPRIWLLIALSCAAFFVADLLLVESGHFARQEIALRSAIYQSPNIVLRVLPAISLVNLSPDPHRYGLILAGLVTIAVVAILVRLRQRASAALLLTNMVGAVVWATILKDVVVRPFDSAYHGHSFPSGHAAGAVVLFGTLAYVLWHTTRHRDIARIGTAVAGVFTVIVGLSAATFHYFSDVLGGFALGGAWLALVLAVFSALHSYRNPSSLARLRSSDAEGT